MFTLIRVPLDNKHVHFMPELTPSGTLLFKAAKSAQISPKWAGDAIKLGWALDFDGRAMAFLHPWAARRGVVLLNPLVIPGESLVLNVGQLGGYAPVNISQGQYVLEVVLFGKPSKVPRLLFQENEAVDK